MANASSTNILILQCLAAPISGDLFLRELFGARRHRSSLLNMDLNRSLGLGTAIPLYPDTKLLQYINLKLASLGCATVANDSDTEFQEMAAALLLHHRETDRLLADYLCPADQRIQSFLNEYFRGVRVPVKLPGQTFVLDRHGLARALSLPPNRDYFHSDIVSSYRVRQGVLHNPKSDRRTTKGIFHIAEGGLPIPADKLGVPKAVFARMLQLALTPPRELLRLPFTAAQKEQAECFVSLLLRPIVCPGAPGFTSQKTMEIRFFAPGNLVSNLDFVESIFGNAGDPFLPENDAGLDVEHWTNHTGCVILAPHLVTVTKKAAGLPHWDNATERQRKDSMCWKKPGELYNDGGAFKLACRDERGVMITIIADNYFGYCKKEVKTQISYSANLFGLCEEEHAGGALVYASYDLGEEFSGDLHVRRSGHSFTEVMRLFSDAVEMKPEGYAVDKKFPEIFYVPEDVHFDLHKQTVSWSDAEGEHHVGLLPTRTYVRPSGYKVRMEKPPGGRIWRLVGTVAEGTVCHKPCTVSGGGKSEISKPITDAIITGPVFVAQFKKDFDRVSELINRDYSTRFKDRQKTDDRPILSPERSLGSVIKLLTPSTRDYTWAYNSWLKSIPQYVKELVFVVKRFYKPEWGDDWRRHFSVDTINGTPGNELKFDTRKMMTTYLRVGFEDDGAWRTFGMRKDFHPAVKLALEDDISASVVVPAHALKNFSSDGRNSAVKFVSNCEYRLFQRPDDAIHRGYDVQTEADYARTGNFFSNYEPLTSADARKLIEESIGFDKFTEPMQELIRAAAASERPAYFVSSAHPRVVDGRPSKNPRYLQDRPDLLHPQDVHLAEMATRLHRRIPLGQPVHTPVNAVLPGRRNNPPDPASSIRSLAVYNPIHFMELPELFTEFICSLTGKSPSTTGAGSEGALTKGPFNALLPILDLNNALVSYLLTGHHGFVTSAGYIGPNVRVDHDISLLIPEVWCRMSAEERDPGFLIAEGYLEKCQDFTHLGRKVLASRLGYRITQRFVRAFFGRLFNHPHAVFPDEMLRPELQDIDVFVDGMDNIVSTQQQVAQQYFEDGSIDAACPPLRALLHIMRHGQFEGQELGHPEIRALFTREHLRASDWYAARLKTKQDADVQLWQRHVAYLETFLTRTHYADEAERLGIKGRLAHAKQNLAFASRRGYLKHLHGSLGTDPSVRRLPARRLAREQPLRVAKPVLPRKNARKIMKTVFLSILVLGFGGNWVPAAVIDFDDAAVGKVPANWTATNTGQGTSKWAVQKDDSAPSKPNVLKQSADAAYPVCIQNEPKLKDGFVQVKFKLISGQEDQAAGVVWRYQDANNYYIARVNALESNVRIYYFKAGKRAQFKGVNMKVSSAEWHTLRVDFSGPTFAVHLDGKPLFEAEDATITDAGQVGLWTKADSVSAFDDFSFGSK
jgi:phosphoenolpyruvate carboxykinase (diphosphate)